MSHPSSDVPNLTYVRKYEKKYRREKASLIDIVHRFGSEEVCRDYLEKLRWEDGKPNCPKCGSESVSHITTRNQYDCNVCRFRFSVTSGTIFDNTKLPLWKWFAAVYLMMESKKSISANQMKRTLTTTYKTAWHLCHRIRQAMNDLHPEQLSGIVEVDETWIGGEQEGVGKGMSTNKAAVIGAVQRDGKIRLQVIKSRDRKTLHHWIAQNVADEAEAIYTDEWKSYRGIADHNTRHETVKHSAKEWVRGQVHTNTVEGVWSLLKRSIIGAFHHVSVKHLDRYLDELEFRFNNRFNQFAFHDIMKRLLTTSALRYQKLIA
jgi:transposase-like protein/IS1 family transposase